MTAAPPALTVALPLIITLGLGALVLPGLSVESPDAVCTHGPRGCGPPGAMRIVDRLGGNTGRVRVAPAEIGIDQRRRMKGRRPIRGVGELAAHRVLDRFFAARPEGRAPLLCVAAHAASRRAPATKASRSSPRAMSSASRRRRAASSAPSTCSRRRPRCCGATSPTSALAEPARYLFRKCVQRISITTTPSATRAPVNSVCASPIPGRDRDGRSSSTTPRSENTWSG